MYRFIELSPGTDNREMIFSKYIGTEKYSFFCITLKRKPFPWSGGLFMFHCICSNGYFSDCWVSFDAWNDSIYVQLYLINLLIDKILNKKLNDKTSGK